MILRTGFEVLKEGIGTARKVRRGAASLRIVVFIALYVEYLRVGSRGERPSQRVWDISFATSYGGAALSCPRILKAWTAFVIVPLLRLPRYSRTFAVHCKEWALDFFQLRQVSGLIQVCLLFGVSIEVTSLSFLRAGVYCMASAPTHTYPEG